MAFVQVQHLAPDHKSILTDLIRHNMSMQVLEVENSVAVPPNCAYIIPPQPQVVILTTSLKKEQDLAQGYALGFISCIRKPADFT